eukprot:CAMPEP_0178450214 /NCGR_PEP_ID=MMETSP0689_2-20121128/42993_1 /TAXON_ID=160604 /ORGANISM="Amphidinium massartii, Strain CS-259" /LENGTH=273 /DNA_ID=CAMNT_0020075641 /DNA_START=199 /DNA_END=1020 /DNA_ORIENTATION=-
MPLTSPLPAEAASHDGAAMLLQSWFVGSSVLVVFLVLLAIVAGIPHVWNSSRKQSVKDARLAMVACSLEQRGRMIAIEAAAPRPSEVLRAVDFSKELGAGPPTGFWDPLKLSTVEDDELAKATFRRRRAVEIQHGRIAMLACTGYIVPEFFKWPGLCAPSEGLAFADIPNGLAAVNAIPFAGWLQIVGFVGLVEITNLGSTPKEAVGDYQGYGAFGVPLGPSITDPERRRKSLAAEINNGRLAMMAIIGMFFQDGLAGGAWADWANFDSSPLR